MTRSRRSYAVAIRFLARLAALLLVLAVARPAVAQDGATLVAVVTAEPNASLTRRVRAELSGLGVDVIVLKPPAEASSSMRAPLEQTARSVGAVAAVRLISSREGRVEVWVADRVTGKAVVRELEASERGGSDASVAVGVVELLRASLMELHGGGARYGDAPATPKVTAIAGSAPAAPAPPPWTPRLSLTLGAGATLATTRIGPEGSAQLAVWARLLPHLGARAFGAFTLAPANLATNAGAVDVRSQVFGAMLVYEPATAEARWAPSLAAGAAAAHVSANGTASAPFVGTKDDSWSFGPTVGAGLALRLARGLRVRVDAAALWALPATRVRVADDAVGRWGAPELLLGGGLELQWAP